MKILFELWLRPFAQGIIGTTAALLGIGLASAAGSAASGIIGSRAASKAAQGQSDAALQAANLQHQDAQAALKFQEQQYQDSITRMQPWLRTGSGATNTLDYLMGMSPQFLNAVTPGTPSQQPAPTLPNIASPGGQIPRTGIPQVSSSNPLANDPNLGPLGAGMVGRGTPQPIQDGTASGGGPINRFAAMVPQTGMAIDNNGLVNGGINPGSATASATPGQVPISGTFPNPDIGTFNAGPPGTAVASTNVGGTAQVPVTDPNAIAAASPGSAQSTLPAGFLNQIWNQQFQAPDQLTEQNDPGFQARLRLGADTLERSAAARGNLLTGGEAKNLDQFAQDYASNEYGNVYNRAANTFSTNYNIFKQNQNDIFNRYATLAGFGQTAAGELNNSGVATAGQVGNTLLTSGAQIGSALQGAAAARGSGYVGSANAVTGAIGSGINSTADLLAMYQAMQKNSSLGAA
jgi:hypothetical protein